MISHELGEPWPHGETIKLTEKRCVMKANPSDGTLFDGIRKRSSGGGRPVVRRIVEFNEELVVSEVGCVDGLGVFDVVNREVVDGGFLLQPELRGIYEWLMDPASLGDGENFEPGGTTGLCGS